MSVWKKDVSADEAIVSVSGFSPIVYPKTEIESPKDRETLLDKGLG